jgi:hypothetical protein
MMDLENALQLVRNVCREDVHPMVRLGNGDTITASELEDLIDDLERVIPAMRTMLQSEGHK